jgi:hypothetical protein
MSLNNFTAYAVIGALSSSGTTSEQVVPFTPPRSKREYKSISVDDEVPEFDELRTPASPADIHRSKKSRGSCSADEMSALTSFMVRPEMIDGLFSKHFVIGELFAVMYSDFPLPEKNVKAVLVCAKIYMERFLRTYTGSFDNPELLLKWIYAIRLADVWLNDRELPIKEYSVICQDGLESTFIGGTMEEVDESEIDELVLLIADAGESKDTINRLIYKSVVKWCNDIFGNDISIPRYTCLYADILRSAESLRHTTKETFCDMLESTLIKTIRILDENGFEVFDEDADEMRQFTWELEYKSLFEKNKYYLWYRYRKLYRKCKYEAEYFSFFKSIDLDITVSRKEFVANYRDLEDAFKQ